MSDNVLDRIRKNRQRAEVPPRDDTLLAKVQPPDVPQASKTIDALPEGELTPVSASAASTGNALEELRAELAKIPETNRHSAIVLEKELDQMLTRYCKDNRITVEVFLEAAWIQVSSNPEVMEQILVEAKRRYANRKRAGKLRRLITMLEGTL
ncbi:hypothetical protein H6F93_01835 [Leptolyngbya sp. FACHB-671]|uniref:hypothetical protein n=1 Tax=Leptolyngbya sp. FACHB-671 TaxID=2692812 RepID=UPI0016878691|nr:hypothetical protein [Leptolyngbya sp. FACHB-671]MBD2066280.1 hypothetical protein [Leptolyngbya sp. FACHB-671]